MKLELYGLQYWILTNGGKMIKKNIIILSISLLSALVIPVYALESNTEYYINSESMFLILEVDSSNNVIFVEGAIIMDDEYHEFDTTQVKVLRITDDGDHGRIFGKTIQGDYYYMIYNIDGENTTLFSILWNDGTKTRIIENAIADKLF